jgi:hypothetical protein
VEFFRGTLVGSLEGWEAVAGVAKAMPGVGGVQAESGLAFGGRHTMQVDLPGVVERGADVAERGVHPIW